MKNYFFSLLVILGISVAGNSQEYSYGIKGGVNQSMGGIARGERSGTVDGTPEGEPNYWNGTAEATGQMGFQVGAFGQINFGKIFVRPEVVYTSIERLYDWPKFATQYHSPTNPSENSVRKLDIPVLGGYNVWGPIDVYAGPVYSNILSSELMADDNREPIILVVQNSSINAQVGIKAEFGRFGLDLRYEHSLSSAEVQTADLITDDYGVNKVHFEDSRINLIKLNVTFKIGGSDIESRRGSPCY